MLSCKKKLPWDMSQHVLRTLFRGNDKTLLGNQWLQIANQSMQRAFRELGEDQSICVCENRAVAKMPVSIILFYIKKRHLAIMTIVWMDKSEMISAICGVRSIFRYVYELTEKLFPLSHGASRKALLGLMLMLLYSQSWASKIINFMNLYYCIEADLVSLIVFNVSREVYVISKYLAHRH